MIKFVNCDYKHICIIGIVILHIKFWRNCQVLFFTYLFINKFRFKLGIKNFLFAVKTGIT